MRNNAERSLFQRLVYGGAEVATFDTDAGLTLFHDIARPCIDVLRNMTYKPEPRIYDALNLQRYLLRQYASQGPSVAHLFRENVAAEGGKLGYVTNPLPTNENCPYPFRGLTEPVWFETRADKLTDEYAEFASGVFPEVRSWPAFREATHGALIMPLSYAHERGLLTVFTASIPDDETVVALTLSPFSDRRNTVGIDGLLIFNTDALGTYKTGVLFHPLTGTVSTETHETYQRSALRDLTAYLFGLSVLNSKTGFSMPLKDSPLMRRIGVRTGDGSPFLFETRDANGVRLRHFVRGHWRTYTERRAEPLTVWVTPHTRGGRSLVGATKWNHDADRAG